MNPSFGTRLRLKREEQHVSLTTVSEQTKIKLSLLEALERDDVSHWPLGIFGRSYIRSYASAIGLDPEATLREFAQAHPSPAASMPAAMSELQEAAADKTGRRPPTRLEVLIDSALDAFHARRTEHAPRKSTSPRPEPSHTPTEVAYSTERTHARLEPAPSIARAENQIIALDLTAVAQICTQLGCALDADEVTASLAEAAALLDATGVILWLPDTMGRTLTPVYAYGYPEEMVAQLPRVSSDANNASAEAFRTRRTCVVDGNGFETGAVVAPLLTPAACGGVLAFELRSGAEQREDVRAAVTILAAQIATLVGYSVLPHAHTLSA